MPKSDPSRPLPGYSTVAERVALFYARFPMGRIVTRLIARSERDVVFRAAVYRAPDERRPAATGWASEREGDGDVNTVACLENTETSAIGRALANLGLTASRERPSAEEMMKAARARARVTHTHVAEPRVQTQGCPAEVGGQKPSVGVGWVLTKWGVERKSSWLERQWHGSAVYTGSAMVEDVSAGGRFVMPIAGTINCTTGLGNLFGFGP